MKVLCKTLYWDTMCHIKWNQNTYNLHHQLGFLDLRSQCAEHHVCSHGQAGVPIVKP